MSYTPYTYSLRQSLSIQTYFRVKTMVLFLITQLTIRSLPRAMYLHVGETRGFGGEHHEQFQFRASQGASDGLQPSSDGLQPTTDAKLPGMASNLLGMASNLLACGRKRMPCVRALAHACKGVPLLRILGWRECLFVCASKPFLVLVRGHPFLVLIFLNISLEFSNNDFRAGMLHGFLDGCCDMLCFISLQTELLISTRKGKHGGRTQGCGRKDSMPTRNLNWPHSKKSQTETEKFLLTVSIQQFGLAPLHQCGVSFADHPTLESRSKVTSIQR